MSKIEDVTQEIHKDGTGSTTYLPDGTKIDTYPGRKSGQFQKPGWSIIKPKASRPTYKEDMDR